jgi:dynein heavy chain
MNELYKIHSFYKFSLDSFVIVVNRAIDIVAAKDKAAKKGDDGEEGGEEGADGEGAEKAEEGEGEKPADEEKPAEGEEGAEAEEEGPTEMTPRTLAKRVDDLTDSITYQAFNYTRRGSFEQHKLIISTMLCFRILVRKGILKQDEVDHLVKKEVHMDPPNQIEALKFIPETSWGAVKGLESLKVFEHII